MKGFMKKTLALFWIAGALASVGCQDGERYRNLVDPCHMERYGAVARQEVITGFTPQVHNGRILDQTIWNYHFDSGTDKLNPSGMDKLDQLVRRRPEPDQRVFLATARDLIYNVDKPDEYAETRRDLDAKRSIAIQKYLAVQTAGRPMQFDVLIHDPADPAIPGAGIRNAISTQRTNYTGVLTRGGGGGAGGGAGTGGAGGVGAGGVPTGGGAPAGAGQPGTAPSR